MKVLTERNTRQRRIVREIFEASGGPLSAEEVVLAGAQRGGAVSLSTVYRSIRSAVEDGWLTVVELPGAIALYELADKPHHHHFICNGCGRVYELSGCAPVDGVQLPPGFRATAHDITISGVCADCPSLSR